MDSGIETNLRKPLDNAVNKGIISFEKYHYYTGWLTVKNVLSYVI